MTVGAVRRGGGTDGHRPAAVRWLDGLAGLLTAGCLVVGVVWLAGRLVAPAFVPAAGAAGGAGPWWGIALHLLVGVGGEIAVRARSPRGTAGRVVVDLVVIAAVGVMLWFVWGA